MRAIKLGLGGAHVASPNSSDDDDGENEDE
jgi:hypothetical protein